jgi:hypothetical protein
MTMVTAIAVAVTAGLLAWSIATGDDTSTAIRAGVFVFNLLAFVHYQCEEMKRR